jgi:hypothetical protein
MILHHYLWFQVSASSPLGLLSYLIQLKIVHMRLAAGRISRKPARPRCHSLLGLVIIFAILVDAIRGAASATGGQGRSQDLTLRGAK